ncbi:hypothetical protein BJ508DRAFT_310190 [Ascobolus immersus RN42]|uniref:F-box domain-containing protein n=1 Tax=Ascobolus immersus RN42 TaxID=1160509 RepID=A0A3N4HVY6_ASCIM|nr:hypothetical protein BJ508DRAFT_310190 [Ascobolus immersus RN42]
MSPAPPTRPSKLHSLLLRMFKTHPNHASRLRRMLARSTTRHLQGLLFLCSLHLEKPDLSPSSRHHCCSVYSALSQAITDGSFPIAPDHPRPMLTELVGISLPGPSAILWLPLEIRLKIYERCTAFALLQFSYACHQVREELADRPSVYRRTFGFAKDPRYIQEATGSVSILPEEEISGPEETTAEEDVDCIPSFELGDQKAHSKETILIDSGEAIKQMEVRTVTCNGHHQDEPHPTSSSLADQQSSRPYLTLHNISLLSLSNPSGGRDETERTLFINTCPPPVETFAPFLKYWACCPYCGLVVRKAERAWAAYYGRPEPERPCDMWYLKVHSCENVECPRRFEEAGFCGWV